MSPAPKLKRRSIKTQELLGIAAMALVVWLACQAGALSTLDNWLYDRSVAATTPISTRSDKHQVVLVYADRKAAAAEPERILRTINTLQRLGATAVGVTFPVENLSREQLHSPDSVIAGAGRSVSTDLIHPRDGINRWHVTAHRSPTENRETRMTLEAALSQIVARPSLIRPSGQNVDYRVRFRGGPNSIPHVSDDDILNQRMVREFIEGRVILVGWKHDKAQPRLVTPTTSNIGMTTLEFRGHALETLLANDANQKPVWPLRLLIPILMALSGYIVGRTFIMRWTVAIAVVATVTFGGVAWILLVWQHLWIPAAPVAASFFISLVLGAFGKMKQKQVELRRSRTSQLASDLALAVQSRCSWHDIANMISQIIEFDRMVLLELPAGSDYLEIVHFENCEMADILEPRRDVMRSPWLDAADRGDIMNLRERIFLKHRTNEDQWLVPFSCGGQVVGFMVVGLDAARLEKDPGLLGRLSHCARETALVVARKQNPDHGVEQTSADSIELDEASDTAIAVCDLFGRMDMLNARMIDLCKRSMFDPGSQSLLQLLGMLLDGGEAEARRQIVRVIVHGETVVRPLRATARSAQRYLQLTPVANPADPFGVEVISLAVFDAPQNHGVQMQDADLAEKVVQPALKNASRVWARSTKIKLPQDIADHLAGDVEKTTAYKAPLASPEHPVGVLARTFLGYADDLDARRMGVEFVQPVADVRSSAPQELIGNAVDVAVRLLLSRARTGSLVRVESHASETQLSIRILSVNTPLTENVRLSNIDATPIWNDLRALHQQLFESHCRVQVISGAGEQGLSLVFPVADMNQPVAEATVNQEAQS